MNDLQIHSTSDSLPATLRRAVGKAEMYAGASMAENTKRNYRSRWLAFTSWCEENGLCPLPASIETVTLFVSDMAGQRTFSTLESYLAAISVAHREAEHPTPCRLRDNPLRKVWRGIQRTHSTAKQKVTPLLAGDIAKIGNYIDAAIDGAGEKDRLALLRDKAILLIGFTGALRRSEIAAIKASGIRYTDEGIVIRLMNTKTDEANKGVEVAIAEQARHCPVKAVKAWIEASGNRTGYVFQRIDRHGNIGDGARPMHDWSIGDIVKRYAAVAGVNPAAVAGHSLRRGCATQMARNGERMDILMNHTRHKTERVAREYIDAGTQFSQDNPTHRLGI